ncbi:MAG: hypothetical protein JXA69_18290 [Phycisphaerae bacterium]|nr:hypothetical protein [Phycisphaerae bacterium]
MTELNRKIRLAQRRLWLNRWLRLLGWSAALAAGAYTLAILPNKLFSLTENPWYPLGAALGAVGAALVGSGAWFLITRESRQTAAAALDVAAGLKERISSGLFCAGVDDPFAQAVVVDAERVSQSITPRSHLRVSYPASVNYALGTVLLAVLVSFVIPPMDLLGTQEERVAETQQEAITERTQVAVKRTFEEARKLAQKDPLLKDVEGLKELDSLLEAKVETPLEVRQEAMKKFDNFLQNAEKQRELGGQEQLEAVKRMLRHASDLQRNQEGLSEKLNQAMAAGDFKSAQETLQKIQQQLEQAAKTPEEKEKAEAMKEQLGQLAQRLEKAAAAQKLDKKTAEALEKAGLDAKAVEKKLAELSKEDLERIAEQLQKQGMSQEQAEKIAKQLQDQKKACQSCKSLAQGLNQAASAMSQAAGASAASSSNMEGLTAASEQLGQLEQLEQQLQGLDATLANLQDMKDSLGKPCSQCNGTGQRDGHPCSGCGGTGCQGQGASGQQGGGMGRLGQGRGGIAPEEATDFRLTKERTQVFTELGTIIGQSFENGEQIKGEASAAFVETAISPDQETIEAKKEQPLPRQYHSTEKAFFDRVNRDLIDQTSSSAPPSASEP